MIYEGVHFIVSACVALGKKRFIATHINAYWPDREEADRKKMLEEVWELMKAPQETKE